MNAFRHESLVDRWLADRVSSQPVARRVELLVLALQAILRRLRAILGELLVVAIFERGLETARSLHPSLAAIDVSWTERMRLHPEEIVREIAISSGDVVGVMRRLLVELFDVVGRLTSDALIPTLEEELAAIGKDADPIPSASSDADADVVAGEARPPASRFAVSATESAAGAQRGKRPNEAYLGATTDERGLQAAAPLREEGRTGSEGASQMQVEAPAHGARKSSARNMRRHREP